MSILVKFTKSQIVSKVKKAKGESVNVIFCPSKMRPRGVWNIGMNVTLKYDKESDKIMHDADYSESIYNPMDFDALLQNFETYNCTRETGLYTHFYVEEEVINTMPPR